jgi:hypothetical protein
MQLIIPPAVKFMLLSTVFTLKMSAVEIHNELSAVYSQNVINEGTLRHWYRMFKDG